MLIFQAPSCAVLFYKLFPSLKNSWSLLEYTLKLGWESFLFKVLELFLEPSPVHCKVAIPAKLLVEGVEWLAPSILSLSCPARTPGGDRSRSRLAVE